MTTSDIEAAVDPLRSARDGPTFRQAQVFLVRRTGNAAAAFWCFATPAAVQQAVDYWSRWLAAHGDRGENRRGFRLLAPQQRWVVDVVMPALAADPAQWIALPALFPDSHSTTVFFWPRRARRMLGRVVTQLLTYDGARLSVLASGDHADLEDAGALRHKAIDLMHEHRDVANPAALAASLAIEFPRTKAFTRCFYRAQETLVGLFLAPDAPFFPTAADADRARAGRYWQPRCGGRPASHPDVIAMKMWRRVHSVDAYRALAPLTNDQAVLRERMTEFLVDALMLDREALSGKWLCETDDWAVVRLRSETVPVYARKHPDARFVPALAGLLPLQGLIPSHLRHGALGELQRTLVWLTGHHEAPVAFADDRESVHRAGRYWRDWWRDHGRAFVLPSAEESERAVRLWRAAGAGGRRRLWVRDRVRKLGAPISGLVMALAGLIGFGLFGLLDQAARRRSSRRWGLPAVLWWPAQIVGFMVFIIAVAVAAIVWAIPYLVLTLVLALPTLLRPWTWLRWYQRRVWQRRYGT